MRRYDENNHSEYVGKGNVEEIAQDIRCYIDDKEVTMVAISGAPDRCEIPDCRRTPLWHFSIEWNKNVDEYMLCEGHIKELIDGLGFTRKYNPIWGSFSVEGKGLE